MQLKVNSQEVKNMFYIVPYIDYELKSLDKKELLLKRFCSTVNIIQTLSFTRTSSYRDFEGILCIDGFKFRRNVRLGYSAFLPILSCKIYEEKKNVRLKVNIQFHKYVNIGIIVFLLFQFSILFFDFSSIALLILPYLFIIYLFNAEVRTLKAKINEIIPPASADVP